MTKTIGYPQALFATICHTVVLRRVLLSDREDLRLYEPCGNHSCAWEMDRGREVALEDEPDGGPEVPALPISNLSESNALLTNALVITA